MIGLVPEMDRNRMKSTKNRYGILNRVCIIDVFDYSWPVG